ncbi:arabinan endo-1,5-alpha-L-arabinosidase [Devosia sp. ZB163]|uniref:arabinan endo-1,5-alpha-L-arabinosidase n=1 Tax=Devosia sp. ZB163 TaxID=3025938 RepID=UPI00235E3554|nr:arabinan endo-1,5-alpha-L-arabinosidase [Devosia sp. ZB163]MDC9825276.1 arabinan endo-1,5-alpha-L-arabinosidase [Devosia sp. ZB163]
MRLVRAALVAALLLCAAPAVAEQAQPALTGDVRIHDPSIIEVDGRYVAFQTGQEGGLYRGAIRAKTSPDGIAWTDAGSIGKGVPKWQRKELGYQSLNIWAPSVSKHGDTWYLYYSVSSFGINTSAIGLMTSTALDPDKPGEGWQDQGLVLKSNGKDDWNAIDPWRIDTTDGRAYLAYGSFWNGIKMRELDPVTGKLLAEDTPTYDLASRQGAGIEATSILEHDGRFYLFVSFDQCCKQLDSTYNMRIGRADSVTGPYLDKDGKPMLEGGGTLLLGKTGRFIGPGGQEAIRTTRGDMLAYHYYDGDDLGVSKLQFSPLRWTADGWPELDPLP